MFGGGEQVGVVLLASDLEACRRLAVRWPDDRGESE